MQHRVRHVSAKRHPVRRGSAGPRSAARHLGDLPLERGADVLDECGLDVRALAVFQEPRDRIGHAPQRNQMGDEPPDLGGLPRSGSLPTRLMVSTSRRLSDRKRSGDERSNANSWVTRDQP